MNVNRGSRLTVRATLNGESGARALPYPLQLNPTTKLKYFEVCKYMRVCRKETRTNTHARAHTHSSDCPNLCVCERTGSREVRPDRISEEPDGAHGPDGSLHGLRDAENGDTSHEYLSTFHTRIPMYTSVNPKQSAQCASPITLRTA